MIFSSIYKKLLVSLLLFPVSCFGNKVTFCYEDINYPPYVYDFDGAETDPQGLLINIIRSAAKNANLPIQFIRRPWLRCQKMVKENQAQALFAMIKTPERTSLYAFPTDKYQTLMTVEYGLFIKRNGILDNKNTLSELAGVDNRLNFVNYKKHQEFGLSAPKGYVAYDILSVNKVLSNFDYILDDGLIAVAENRLDGYVVSKQIGLNKIMKYDLSNSIIWSQIILDTSDWYIPFNHEYYKRHKDKIEKFWFEIGNVKGKEIESYSFEFK